MKLVKIKLKNFRCYRDEQEVCLDKLTAVIGQNDVGKSSILEAIDGFFNDSLTDKDLCTDAQNEAIELTCCFENIPDEVVLDASVPSCPIDEGILNSNNQLEVKKVFKFGGRTSKSVYLISNHPSDLRLKKLLSMKNEKLKDLAKGFNLDLTGIDQKKNPPMRQVIRDYIGGDRMEIELKVDGNLEGQDNLKDIWKSLKKLLPVFSLFKTDKAFDDKDGDIKNPLQSAINEALALPEIQTLLERVEEKVRKYSTDIANETIEKLKNFDITEELKSDFNKDPSYSRIFDITLLNEKNIPLNKRGSGIRRLVVLSFFQAQAEKRKINNEAPSIIYALEEPETSQHPDHQKKIISTLIELSKQENIQVIFTTHNANLVREIPLESLMLISSSDGKRIIDYGIDPNTNEVDDDVIDKIILTLGILPDPSGKIKVLVYVEGSNDVTALKEYSHIISQEDSSFIDLTKSKEVGYVPTGGNALIHYYERKYLSGLGLPEVHIYDNDDVKYRLIVAKINDDKDEQKIAFNTSKLELENYLHHEAIIDAYADEGTVIQLAEIGDQDDVPSLVAQATSGSSNPSKKCLDGKKQFLNNNAVRKMSVERIKARGGYEDLTTWFDVIRKFI